MEIRGYHVQLATRAAGCASSMFVICIGLLTFTMPATSDVYSFCHWLADGTLNVLAGAVGLYAMTKGWGSDICIIRSLTPMAMAFLMLFVGCLIVGEDVSDQMSALSGSRGWAGLRDFFGILAWITAVVCVPVICLESPLDGGLEPRASQSAEERKGLLGGSEQPADVYGNYFASGSAPAGGWNSIVDQIRLPQRDA